MKATAPRFTEETPMDRRRFIHTTASITLVAAATGAHAAKRKTAMPNYIEQVTTLITDWRRKDIKAVLSRVTDDIAWHTHVGSPPVNGKPAMEQVLNTLATQMNDVKWRIFHYAQHDERIFLEGVDDFVNPEGRRIVIPYAGVLAFRGGLVSEWRDYFDRNLFNKLKAGEPAPDFIDALTARKALF
jgi:limonene-1,2-epoxide hydrolase